jgi:transcriptional regulator with XRE-family HTH domain
VAGSLVLSARLKADLTQRDFASRLGVAQSVVSAYETGRRQPTVPTLMRILAAAGFDLRLTIEPHDDHDDVLKALEERRPVREQKIWLRKQNEIVEANRKGLELRT